jgi:hypothetical protein
VLEPSFATDFVARRPDGLSDPATGPLTSGAGGASPAAPRLSGTGWSQPATAAAPPWMAPVGVGCRRSHGMAQSKRGTISRQDH